jgi:hypothetical protein
MRLCRNPIERRGNEVRTIGGQEHTHRGERALHSRPHGIFSVEDPVVVQPREPAQSDADRFCYERVSQDGLDLEVKCIDEIRVE